MKTITSLAQSRYSRAIEFLNKGNVAELVNTITLPRQSFGAVMQSNEYDLASYGGEAVDRKNLLVSVVMWADNILETDDFSTKLTNELLAYQDENNTHFWDYNIESFLEENGYDIGEYEHRMSDYTYNDSDFNCLDRDIHFTLFEFDSEIYVCFSIHHGADARAGFSDSIVLKVKDYDYFFNSMEIMAYNSVTDEDYSIWELEDIAFFDCGDWYLKETDELIYIHSSADGY